MATSREPDRDRDRTGGERPAGSGRIVAIDALADPARLERLDLGAQSGGLSAKPLG